MHDIIGSVLPSSPRPLWVRAVMSREGQDVVTRCCIVADGDLFPFEVRINIPRLVATARRLGLGAGTDTVGGFGSFLKKAVKKITKNKVVKAVGKVASKVVKSPIVQLANPSMALGLHGITKAATGKGIIKGRAGTLVDAGTAAVMSKLGVPASLAVPNQGLLTKGGVTKAIPGALSFISPKATAALGVGLRTVGVAKTGGAIASVAKQAQKQIGLGKVAAQAIMQKTADPTKAKALVQRAVDVQKKVQALAPQLAKQAVLSNKVKTQLASIAAKAKAGSADAILARSVISKAATAMDTIQRLQGQAVGGLPGLLITAQGKIVRAPKGRFALQSTTTLRPDILYRGAKEPTLKGLFSAVSGAESWGGVDDPGNDIEGPRYRVPVRGGGWSLDDYSTLPGNAQVGVLTP